MTVATEDLVDSASIAAASTKRKPLWQLAIRNPNVIFGGVILLIMVAIAILAPFLGTVDPTRIDPAARNKKPGTEITFRLEDGKTAKRTVLMGTDSLGRDVYSRVIYGTRVSLAVGAAVALIAIAIGVVIGLGVAILLGGAVVTESVFGLPGLGRLTVEAVLSRDFPTIQTVILMFSVVYVLINLLIDISYTVFDPRIRY